VASCLLALAGCSSGGPSEADIHWASMMVPHHEAGITLDDLALTRTDDVRVRHLAFEMNGYQGGELDELRRLARGAPSDMAVGMPTAAEMADLAERHGPGFDRQFLTLMIRHHEGALAMAGAPGASARVHRLAATLVTVQTEQLARLRALLAEIG
jgi:uncharacterized protein (DUF305 family)